MRDMKWEGGIAIVDDERVIVEFYKKVFETMAVPIAFVAYDGEDAVNKFKCCNKKPQVILMDFRMPGMDGVEAAKTIIGHDPAVKIIFITADSGAREDALRSGAAGFIKKPVSLKEIVTQVEEVMCKTISMPREV